MGQQKRSGVVPFLIGTAGKVWELEFYSGLAQQKRTGVILVLIGTEGKVRDFGVLFWSGTAEKHGSCSILDWDKRESMGCWSAILEWNRRKVQELEFDSGVGQWKSAGVGV